MARILVVGAGSVGCYFGAQLLRAGNEVTFLARSAHAQALQANGLEVELRGKLAQFRVNASDDARVAGDAELILISVKSYDTAATASELAPYLSANARVVCLQNGVTNHEIFATHAKHRALPAVVYVAAQMETRTHLLVNAPGSLVLGCTRDGTPDDLQPLVRQFEDAGIPCRVSEFIERELWEKLIINCAFNGISACAGARYGALMNSAETRELMTEIVREGVAVANALEIPLDFETVKSATWKVGETMHAAISSTAQDLQRGKRTEIDFLNGHIVAAGKRCAIATPANQAVFALVRLIETTR